ncbi:MAG TPA: transposase [Acetobacteraceae bacterium]|nr:transposase [Acetobacteraceae bacterium]
MPTLNPRLLPRIPARRWQPLTDAEWAALRPWLPPEGGPGRPSDKRKVVNAIFWIAASKEPWKNLPSHLGNGESAARTLRRWARAGLLDRLLIAVSDHPLGGGCATLRRLAWFICRAFRRMARILPEDSVILAQRLRMTPALPAIFIHVPDPVLSETLKTVMRQQVAELRTACRTRTLALLESLKAGHKALVTTFGNRRKWRLK